MAAIIEFQPDVRAHGGGLRYVQVHGIDGPEVTEHPPHGPLGVVPDARTPTAATFRRRRVAVAVAASALVLVLPALAGAAVRSLVPGSGAPPRSVEYHVVGPGDTMYSIAAEFDPSGNPADIVDELVQLNDGRASVQPGDVIALPEPPT